MDRTWSYDGKKSPIFTADDSIYLISIRGDPLPILICKRELEGKLVR